VARYATQRKLTTPAGPTECKTAHPQIHTDNLSSQLRRNFLYIRYHRLQPTRDHQMDSTATPSAPRLPQTLCACCGGAATSSGDPPLTCEQLCCTFCSPECMSRAGELVCEAQGQTEGAPEEGRDSEDDAPEDESEEEQTLAYCRGGGCAERLGPRAGRCAPCGCEGCRFCSATCLASIEPRYVQSQGRAIVCGCRASCTGCPGVTKQSGTSIPLPLCSCGCSSSARATPCAHCKTEMCTACSLEHYERHHPECVSRCQGAMCQERLLDRGGVPTPCGCRSCGFCSLRCRDATLDEAEHRDPRYCPPCGCASMCRGCPKRDAPAMIVARKKAIATPEQRERRCSLCEDPYLDDAPRCIHCNVRICSVCKEDHYITEHHVHFSVCSALGCYELILDRIGRVEALCCCELCGFCSDACVGDALRASEPKAGGERSSRLPRRCGCPPSCELCPLRPSSLPSSLPTTSVATEQIVSALVSS
jgi:hypothetical protein